MSNHSIQSVNSVSDTQTFASKALPRIASLVPLLVAMSCLGAMNGGIFSVPRYVREGEKSYLLSNSIPLYFNYIILCVECYWWQPERDNGQFCFP